MQKSAETRDPVERYVPLALKIAVYIWLTYFLYQAATTFVEYTPGRPWPFMLSVFRMFTFLPIHEAGHFLFVFFGRTLNILGGSFWQIVFPLLWFVIALRQQSQVAWFALFWVGENLMDVSLYMRDAPFRQLPLLGGHKSGHDWYNLLSDWDIIEWAEPLADIFYYGGFIIAMVAILAGLFLAFRSCFSPPRVMRHLRAGQVPPSTLDDSLDKIFANKEAKEQRLD